MTEIIDFRKSKTFLTCDSDCDKCGDCKEKDKLNYCKKKENASKLVCKNFYFFEQLESFSKIRQERKYVLGSPPVELPKPKPQPDPDEDPEVEDPDEEPEPEPDDEEPGEEPGKEILPKLPNISGYTSWRFTFQNAADIVNELLKQNYTMEQINEMISVAELSSLHYHPFVHQLGKVMVPVGSTMFGGAVLHYGYEKLFRKRQFGKRARIVDRYDPFEEEFGVKKPKPSARTRAPGGRSTTQRDLRTTTGRKLQLPEGTELQDTGPDSIQAPDIEDPPPDPVTDRDPLIKKPKPKVKPPKTETVEDKKPLLGEGDEPSTIDAPDEGDSPEPEIPDPDPIEDVDPFETALNQFTIEQDVTFTEGYQSYLRDVLTKDLAPEKMLPTIRVFYNTQIQYFNRQIPTLQGKLDASFDLLQEDLNQVNMKNLQGAKILEKIQKSTNSARPALMEQANQIKAELQELNTDLQSQVAIYKTNYTNYKKMVDDKNYFEGQNTEYSKVALDPEVVSNNDTFTTDIEPKSNFLNTAANNAENTINAAKAEGISWAAEQEVEVVQAIDAYNIENDANLNISQGEIQKIINAGGDYESSISQYYETFKKTQTDLIQVQKNFLTNKFNNYKQKFTELKTLNQNVLDEMDILDTMKTDGTTVANMVDQQQKILGMIEDLDALRSENTAAYSAYFSQNNTYEAVVKDSNNAIKTINSKYKNPPVPDDVQEFYQFTANTSDVESQIRENITNFTRIVNGAVSEAEAAEELQNIKNATNALTLADADANITQLEAQLKNAKTAMTDVKSILNQKLLEVEGIMKDLKNSEDQIPFVSPAQVQLEDMRSLTDTYDNKVFTFNLKRAVLIEAIENRNDSDAFTQLIDAGQSPTEMDIPENATDEYYQGFEDYGTSTAEKYNTYSDDWYEISVNAESTGVQVSDFSDVNQAIASLKGEINQAVAKLAQLNLELDNPNLTDEERTDLLSQANEQDKIIKERQPQLLAEQQEKSTMLSEDRTLLQQVKTDADTVFKNDLGGTPPEEVPEVYQTQMDSLNTQMSSVAEDITETMNIDPEINVSSLEIEGLMSGTRKAFGAGSMTARLTSNLTRAARTLRSTKALYTDLFSRFTSISREATLEELAAGVEDVSIGSRVLSGTSMLIGATSSFISRALMAPVLYGATALAGPYIGSMIAGIISRSMGPIGMVVALGGVGFQIWADQQAQPPATFMLKATNSTQDTIVMPLPT